MVVPPALGPPENPPKITQIGPSEELVRFSLEPNPNKLAKGPESANFGRLFGRRALAPYHMEHGQPEQAPKITQIGPSEELVRFSLEPNPNKLAKDPESANFGKLFGRKTLAP